MTWFYKQKKRKKEKKIKKRKTLTSHIGILTRHVPSSLTWGPKVLTRPGWIQAYTFKQTKLMLFYTSQGSALSTHVLLNRWNRSKRELRINGFVFKMPHSLHMELRKEFIEWGLVELDTWDTATCPSSLVTHHQHHSLLDVRHERCMLVSAKEKHQRGRVIRQAATLDGISYIWSC